MANPAKPSVSLLRMNSALKFARKLSPRHKSKQVNNKADEFKTEASIWDEKKASAVIKMIEYLNEYGVTLDGLYRKQGENFEQKDIFTSFSDGKLVDLTKLNPHSVATIVKKILRDSMPPLFTYETYDMLQGKADSAHDLDMAIGNAIAAMPESNKKVLSCVLQHLTKLMKVCKPPASIDTLGGTIGVHFIRKSESIDDRDYKSLAKRKLIATAIIRGASKWDYSASVATTRPDNTNLDEQGKQPKATTWTMKTKQPITQDENKSGSAGQAVHGLPPFSAQRVSSMLNMISFLSDNCLEQKGLYRKLGETVQQKELLDNFLNDKTPDLKKFSPHSIASVMKQILREVHEPLLSYRGYGLIFQSLASEEELKHAICDTIQGLPELNRSLLQEMLLHLQEVANTSGNEMDNDAVGASVGIHLVRRSESTDDSDYRSLRCRRMFAKIFIMNADKWPYGCDRRIIAKRLNSMRLFPSKKTKRKSVVVAPVAVESKIFYPPITMEAAGITRKMAEFLRQNASNIAGLFRVQGKSTEQKELFALISAGELPDLHSYAPHSVASVIKQVLRDQYAPLLTYDAYDMIANAIESPDQLKKTINSCLHSFSHWSRLLICVLLDLLRKIQSVAFDGDTLEGLSASIGVILLRKSESPEDQNYESTICRKAVAGLLIENALYWEYELSAEEKPKSNSIGSLLFNTNASNVLLDPEDTVVVKNATLPTNEGVLNLTIEIAQGLICCIEYLFETKSFSPLLFETSESKIDSNELLEMLPTLDKQNQKLNQLSIEVIANGVNNILQRMEPLISELEYQKTSGMLPLSLFQWAMAALPAIKKYILLALGRLFSECLDSKDDDIKSKATKTFGHIIFGYDSNLSRWNNAEAAQFALSSNFANNSQRVSQQLDEESAKVLADMLDSALSRSDGSLDLFKGCSSLVTRLAVTASFEMANLNNLNKYSPKSISDGVKEILQWKFAPLLSINLSSLNHPNKVEIQNILNAKIAQLPIQRKRIVLLLQECIAKMPQDEIIPETFVQQYGWIFYFGDETRKIYSDSANIQLIIKIFMAWSNATSVNLQISGPIDYKKAQLPMPVDQSSTIVQPLKITPVVHNRASWNVSYNCKVNSLSEYMTLKNELMNDLQIIYEPGAHTLDIDALDESNGVDLLKQVASLSKRMDIPWTVQINVWEALWTIFRSYTAQVPEKYGLFMDLKGTLKFCTECMMTKKKSSCLKGYSFLALDNVRVKEIFSSACAVQSANLEPAVHSPRYAQRLSFEKFFLLLYNLSQQINLPDTENVATRFTFLLSTFVFPHSSRSFMCCTPKHSKNTSKSEIVNTELVAAFTMNNFHFYCQNFAKVLDASQDGSLKIHERHQHVWPPQLIPHTRIFEIFENFKIVPAIVAASEVVQTANAIVQERQKSKLKQYYVRLAKFANDLDHYLTIPECMECMMKVTTHRLSQPEFKEVYADTLDQVLVAFEVWGFGDRRD